MGSRPRRDITHYVTRHLESLSLEGKVAVDVPAGSGRISRVLRDRGAEVHAFDLFPEFFEVSDLCCQPADLMQRVPMPNRSADLIVCQEGIEHLPNHLHALREFNRVLRGDGRLILTTPNISHLRGRLSRFLNESDLYSRLPATEVDSIWFGSEDPSEVYFGHIFLLGIQQLRILSRIAGFRIERLHFTRPSWGSVGLGLTYPLLVLSNLFGYAHSLRRHDQADPAWKRAVYLEALKLNLDPKVLFGKHLFVEFVKEKEVCEAVGDFHRKLEGGVLQPMASPSPQPALVH